MAIQVAHAADGADAHRAGLRTIEQLTAAGRLNQGELRKVETGETVAEDSFGSKM